VKLRNVARKRLKLTTIIIKTLRYGHTVNFLSLYFYSGECGRNKYDERNLKLTVKSIKDIIQ
jgi:hypothetical protein